MAVTCLSLLASLPATSQTLRDPTRPGKGQVVTSSSQTTTQKLVLKSIVTGANRHAVINDQIVSVGEVIQGRRVSYIGDDYVNFSDGGKLQLFKSVIKR
ncbi:MSHA biogenesis protein MshK [Shewanella maritima]|uniref:MSHA biogenesis protein MshK n=1 Tax=Shewanella maritima TaxID=2520507 RepID=A0A411PIU8_9GAMM|nr:MSHA biogenesis protein MshK [Shewanella maritima]QBF83322.1 MSHA biogenesis protein MshK [Shewanella maritima]